jgi:hypothetical protein
VEGEGPHDEQDAGRRRWIPHLTRATTWLLGTVVAAIVGVVVPGVIGGWLPGTGGGEDEPETEAEKTRRTPAVRPARLVTSEKVGLYNVELDGSSQGAINVHGQPRSRKVEDDVCVMKWRGGLEIDFYNLGAQDPCVYGRFCWAHITGSEWATSKGLRVGDRTRRMFQLYPEADHVEEPGLVRRYVIEPATAPCGFDSKVGLEAWTGSGKVFALRVSFLAGGD